jgi:hypothetical protein
MRRLVGVFTDHPASVNETYAEHMGMAFRFGGRMLLAGCACLLHGIFPFLCVRTGSRTIAELHGAMVTHRTVKPPADAAVVRR